MNRKRTILRHWLATLLAAVCIPLGTQTAWADDDPFYAARTARTNNTFTFSQPAYNVEVTVSYVDAGVEITNDETTLYYATLADVFANVDNYADGDVITLQTNETLTTGITISKAITLDLNGKTLTYEGTGTAVSINSDGALTICDNSEDGNGGIISAVANSSTINNAGTLTISGGNISSSGEDSPAILNTGTLTVSGGNISSTNGYAIDHIGTTFNLSGAPTLTSINAAAINLGQDEVITIDAALTAPTAAWKVESYNITASASTPYNFTTGWSVHQTIGTTVADPGLFFASNNTNVKTRLVDGTGEGTKEAQFVYYKALDANVVATVPVITNNGQTDVGSRTASLAEGNVWVGDQLSVMTTATPGITWQWYRVSGTTETAISEATASTYTLTADDVDFTIIAKATQPANIAGTGNPASDVVVATAATVAVVKKDNFGTLAATDDDFTTYDTDKSDYVKIELTTARTDIEYMVVASDATGVTENSLYWTKATCPEADGPFALSQYVTVSGETAILSNMLPGTTYKLYYRQKETTTTKHGTTATTDGKPVNEANITFTTRTFDYLVTTQGVTYKISEDPTATVTATVTAISGEGTGDHKTATILATIPAAEITRADVYTVLGYTITSGFTVSSELSEITSLATFGSDADHYGQLTVKQTSIYNQLKDKNRLSKGSQEGYVIFNYKSGYFTLGDADGGHETVAKGNSITDNLTATLTIDGLTGTDQGSTAFTDADGALPLGTADYNLGKPLAAWGELVTVTITLPAGFGFVNATPQITATGTASAINLTVDPQNSRIWTASFLMPEDNATVAFADGTTIQGTPLTYTYTAPTATQATVTAGEDFGTTIRVVQELTYTIEPLHTGVDYYALTDLGLTEGVTATIVDFSDETVTVTLPTEKKVKVTFKAPATFTGDAVTFAPVMTKVAEDITFAAGNTTYKHSNTEGIALHGENANLTFCTVTGVSGSTVTTAEITSKQIPAGLPVIVQNTSGAAIIARMDIGEYDAVTYDNTHFKGTVEAKTMTDSGYGPWHWADNMKYYGFNGLGDFVWINEAGNVAAHKCWLMIQTGGTGGSLARQLSVVWPDGSTTRINGVNADDEDGDWYDLNGRKLQAKPQRKGVYILNGQKKVVK